MPDSRMPVLLFDGECGLCSAIVRFLIRRDPAGRLRFAPLQGPVAREYLRLQGLPLEEPDSLVFVPDWNKRLTRNYLLRTAGALACCAELGGAWRAAAWLKVIPAFLRDPAYRLVSRLRKRLSAKLQLKVESDPSWAHRFLER